MNKKKFFIVFFLLGICIFFGMYLYIQNSAKEYNKNVDVYISHVSMIGQQIEKMDPYNIVENLDFAIKDITSFDKFIEDIKKDEKLEEDYVHFSEYCDVYFQDFDPNIVKSNDISKTDYLSNYSKEFSDGQRAIASNVLVVLWDMKHSMENICELTRETLSIAHSSSYNFALCTESESNEFDLKFYACNQYDKDKEQFDELKNNLNREREKFVDYEIKLGELLNQLR